MCMVSCVGEFFPAILSQRLGLCKSVMDLMLPLYDHSFNGTAFAKMLREMHSIKYAETANAYLNRAKQHMEANTLTPVSAENVADFGSFFDFFGCFLAMFPSFRNTILLLRGVSTFKEINERL